MMEKQQSRFKEKVVLVFGGAVGIGKKIVESFAREAATVVLVDIDTKNAEQVSSGLQKNGWKVDFFNANITQEEEIQQAVAKVIKKYQKIDIVVNNVRGEKYRSSDPFESPLSEWIQGFHFILGGVYVTLKYILPQMIKQKSGIVLNMASVSGMVIGDESLQYHIAKSGLIQLTKYVADKYGKFGIRANCISPGFIVRDEDLARFNDEQNKNYQQTAIATHPLRKIGSPQDVANAVLFLCSEESSFITGENLVVDGGLTIRDQWSVANQIRKGE